MKENVHILHESAMKLKGTFSFHGFCYPWMSWNQSKNIGGGFIVSFQPIKGWLPGTSCKYCWTCFLSNLTTGSILIRDLGWVPLSVCPLLVQRIYKLLPLKDTNLIPWWGLEDWSIKTGATYLGSWSYWEDKLYSYHVKEKRIHIQSTTKPDCELLTF